MLTHCSSRLHYLFLLILTGTLLLSCGEKEKKKSYIRQIRLVRAIQISNSIPFNDTQKKLTLPASALITGKDSKNYVWVINTKTHQVHRRHITIGEQTGLVDYIQANGLSL